MQINPQGILLLDTNNLHTHKLSAQVHSYHHGHTVSASDSRSISLHSIPSESLTHITAFLDPASLFALGRTDKLLYEHVSDDNTWHRAFSCQFLGHGPDSDSANTSKSQQSILLRRSEDSWKKEFVLRCNLLCRWERSRNGTVAHTPHLSPIACMNLLSERAHGPALLSASLQYGIVARSLPLTGKILKGFLSASDRIGIGIGNPNAEFMPNASACAISSEGWTARVVWGCVSGEVAIASATRIMEAGRTTSKVVRCAVVEEHRGRVVDVSWDSDIFVTAGVDGEVRVWDAKRVRCVWVLKDQNGLVPDACVHVVTDLARGIVLATKQSGTTVVWSGIPAADKLSERPSESEMNVALPKLRISPPGSSNENIEHPEIVKVFIDPGTFPSKLSFGILFAGDSHFYRVNADLSSDTYEYIRFANGPLGPLCVMYPFFRSFEEEGSGGGGTVIFTGDVLGRVSLFDWSANPRNNSDAVSSFRWLDAHPDADGGVTVIACNSHILAAGSARGTTRIYDLLTLRLLREFPSPFSRSVARRHSETEVGQPSNSNAVKEIILDRDLLLVAVGERVLAWKAGPVKAHNSNLTIRKSTAKGKNAKWFKRLEIAQDITESRQAAADSHKHAQKSYERQRAQLATLDDLGLDEHEALEYVLMLSRDEEEARSVEGCANRERVTEEGVFGVAFDDIPPAADEYPTPFPSPPSGPSLRLSPNPSPSRMCSSSTRSNAKVQVSPPLRLEPMEAGFSTSPLGVNIAAHIRVPPALEDTEHFPTMSASGSNAGSPSVSGSWSARVKAPPPASVSRTTSTAPDTALLSANLRINEQSTAASISRNSSTVIHSSRDGSEDEELDVDLKLAIELSLAEALSWQQF